MSAYSERKKNLWIALDFDGTLVGHKYPEIGRDAGAVPYLKSLMAAYPNVRFVLNTMRSGDELGDAVEWCAEHGVPLHGVNRNPTQSWTTSPKVYAHIYVDDAALGTPLVWDDDSCRHMVDWERAGPVLLNSIERVYRPLKSKEPV